MMGPDTGLLLAVVTLMSVFNHSHLVILPSHHHTQYTSYYQYILTYYSQERNGDHWFLLKPDTDVLNENDYNATIQNYMKLKEIINKNEIYNQVLTEYPSIHESEDEFLTRLLEMEGCGERIGANIEKYIEKRYDDTEKPSTEEIAYLASLIPMSRKTGRLTTLYLSNSFATNQNDNDAQTDPAVADGSSLGSGASALASSFIATNVDRDRPLALKSMWLTLIRKLEPMLGESYMSYALRVIKQNKMPLPQNLIPNFFCKRLRLFENFDVWPEYNGSFVMYYLLSCPLQSTTRINFDFSSEDND